MQWKELWNDIMRLYDEIFKENKGQDTNHSMGAIVLKPKELGGVEKYAVIDGQRRIARADNYNNRLAEPDIAKTEQFIEELSVFTRVRAKF